MSKLRLSKEQFGDLFSGEIKNSAAPKKLLNYDRVIRAIDFVCEPGMSRIVERPDGTYINNWVNDGAAPVEGDPSMGLQHIEYLVPDASYRRYLIQALAYLIQNPGKRLRFVILITGKPGTGKSLLGRLMKLIIGPSNCREVSTEELRSGFQDYIEGVLLLIVEELMAAGRLELGNTLKSQITADEQWVNIKNQRPRRVKVLFSGLAFSNHRHAIHVEPGDRRWFVIDSPAEPKEPAYYTVLADWIEQNAGVFRRHLETVDLTGFNPAAPPPMTNAKAEMIEDSRTPMEWAIRHMLTEGVSPLDGDVVTLEAVLQAVRQDVPRATTQAVLGVLKGLGAAKLPRIRLGQGIQVSPWAIRRPELWLQATPEAIREALQGQRRVA
ncbi:MAG: primase-helicase family protein [Ferrovibrio sp.]|uniref:primase-helicase family protein n=1 Tax=Ferrovibrio sp. TaxID=1917215 RepID=UPI00391DC1A2